jgi:hypothetical protein
VQSILHAHLIPAYPAGNMFGRKGRAWLAAQKLPEDERMAIERHVREIDRLGEDLKVIQRDLAQYGLADLRVKRLMTVPGLDMIVATALVAAIGDVSRFGSPQKLVSYLGLNPSVRQSGSGPAYHGRVSKQGPGRARGLLVEAAWAAARAPGPLRAFFLRIRARRGQHVAAVATARKLAVLVWHLLTKEQDYLWVRPALHTTKLRRLELTAGHAPARGQRGSAYDYNIKATRDQERRRAQQARRSMSGLSPAGTEVAQGCARALQKRSDNNGRAARLSPQTLLIAMPWLRWPVSEHCELQPTRLRSPRDDCRLCHTVLAATNKSLAQSNKSPARHRSTAGWRNRCSNFFGP